MVMDYGMQPSEIMGMTPLQLDVLVLEHNRRVKEQKRQEKQGK